MVPYYNHNGLSQSVENKVYLHDYDPVTHGKAALGRYVDFHDSLEIRGSANKGLAARAARGPRAGGGRRIAGPMAEKEG